MVAALRLCGNDSGRHTIHKQLWFVWRRVYAASTANVSDSLFYGNTSGTGEGGGLYSVGAIKVAGTQFISNTANRVLAFTPILLLSWRLLTHTS